MLSDNINACVSKQYAKPSALDILNIACQQAQNANQKGSDEIPMNTTIYGTKYDPCGLNDLKYYDLMYELINYTKEKGLTVRQARKLFMDCSDMVLDATNLN